MVDVQTDKKSGTMVYIDGPLNIIQE